VLEQHIDQLQADGVAEGFRDRRHPLRLFTLDMGVDDRLAARFAYWWLAHRLGRAPRFHANRDEFGIAAHNAGDRNSVARWLALRPEFSTQARMPPTAFLAPRGVRRGLPVLTAGLVPDSYRRYPTGPMASSLSRAGSLALFLPRYPNGGTGRLEDDDTD
jgi:hypothetical protein